MSKSYKDRLLLGVANVSSYDDHLGTKIVPDEIPRWNTVAPDHVACYRTGAERKHGSTTSSRWRAAGKKKKKLLLFNRDQVINTFETCKMPLIFGWHAFIL
jgi:hypothetical protein